MKIFGVKKNDTVMVLSGKDKGKKGKVLKVLYKSEKVLVDGVNVVKRHTKPRPPKEPRGGILEKTMPLLACKVMVVCSHCSKPTRIKKEEREEKVLRICKQCGKEI